MRAKKRQSQDWRETPGGVARYKEARASAQTLANMTGFDHLLTKNDVFKTFMVSMLPQKGNRFGRDLDGEVVYCENLATCQKGHGPCAQ